MEGCLKERNGGVARERATFCFYIMQRFLKHDLFFILCYQRITHCN